VPADGDYQVSIAGSTKPARGEPDEDHGVAVIGNGTAVTVETPKLGKDEKDTLSIGHEGAIGYKTGHAGEFPAIRLAADGANGGMHARLSHMNADAGDEIQLKMDHAAGQLTVAGGGKKASSFDLKVTHVQASGEDRVNEQKGIKFQPGMTHTIQSSPTAAKGAAPFKVAMQKTPPPPVVKPTATPAPTPAPVLSAKPQAHAAPAPPPVPVPKKH
jgi:hypothetical protein